MVVNLLVDSEQIAHGSIHLSEEERKECIEIESEKTDEPIAHDPLFLDLLDAEEFDRYVNALEASRVQFTLREQVAAGARVRDDIGSEGDFLHPPRNVKPLAGIWLDEEFHKLSRWLQELRVVEGSEREKHWPPPQLKDKKDLIAYSIGKRDVGWLNVGTNPIELRSYALQALAAYFFETLADRNDEYFFKERADDFLTCWQEIFCCGTFRLGVIHRQVMGLENGKDCVNMVYDFDPDSKQFHCFPAETFPDVEAVYREDELDIAQ
jgi:hypothetical protein